MIITCGKMSPLVGNSSSCRNRILDISPDSLYEVLKQYNMSTGFIKSISNGINFPPENEVDITLKTPDYDIIKKAISK